MEFRGLPLHPLLVHATVVLVPLATVFAVLLGVAPGWRWLTRWPAATLTVVGLVLAWVSKLSGDALVASRPELAQLVERHEQLGELLAYAMVPFTAAVVLAAWSLAGTTALASGRWAQGSRLPALEKVLPVLLVLGAAGVLLLVVLTGESGARAVWGHP